MKYIRSTETDICAEEGKQASETTNIKFLDEAAEGFKDTAEFKMPKSGRIDFKRHILPHLLACGTKGNGLTKLMANATAIIAVDTDDSGNVSLRCRELTSTNALE